jgi:hypothetical protein
MGDNMGLGTDITMGLLLTAANVVLLSVLVTAEEVYAQTTTPPEGAEESTTSTTVFGTPPTQSISPSAQQIINNAKAECEAAYFFQPRCVELAYESPTTVVLRGLVIMFGGHPEGETQFFYSNPFLWKAVDAFKAQGYEITDVEVSVLGKSANSEFNVIMSK